jgi:excinuclease ABC subunit C
MKAMEGGRSQHPLGEVAARAPELPGVYLFLDGRGRVLYVGKARQLRRRVLSYFLKDQPSKTVSMLSRAKELRFVVTHNEVEALILENRLIKDHRPRYNVLLRDDKTYPYIKLTTSEYWPRALLVRRIERDGSEYFGPFLGHGTAARLMDLIRMYTQVRTCSWDLKPEGTLSRPCLYYSMGACLGPCVAGLTSPEAYREAVAEVRLLLAGNTGDLAETFKKRMWEAAERQDYERAARLRDLARAVESLKQGQLAELPGRGSFDVFGASGDGRDLTVVVLVYRDGKLVDTREYHFEGIEESPEGEFFSQFLPQFYEANPAVPEEVLLPTPLEDMEALASFLREKRGKPVDVHHPQRGEKRSLVRLAQENAQEAFRLRFRHPRREGERLGQELQKVLGLPQPVERLECFDVSHLAGEAAVVSLVVWEKGRLAKKEYRTFHLKTAVGGDDPAAVAEAVQRRYGRQLREGKPLPQLVVIDGGPSQLTAATQALQQVGVQLPVVALAKRFEDIYLDAKKPPLRLPNHSEVRLLLQKVRDEAHRFALTRHRQRRRKRRLATQLLAIPGVGPQRAKALLAAFGSLEAVRKATVQELAHVVGSKLAGRIWANLHPEEAPKP